MALYSIAYPTKKKRIFTKRVPKIQLHVVHNFEVVMLKFHKIKHSISLLKPKKKKKKKRKE